MAGRHEDGAATDGETAFILSRALGAHVCTLVVAWRVFREAPVCVGANRDEARDRPASPPAVRGENPRVLAPRDERAGGTWIGYNEHDVFVAVTNRWVEGDGERSRGLLVDDALAEPTAAAARDRVAAELSDRAYAPFYLVIADDRDCILVEHGGGVEPAPSTEVVDDGHAVAGQSGHGDPDDRTGSAEPRFDGYRIHDLDPGVHVVGNVGFDGAWFVPPARPEAGRRQAANAERLRAALQPREGESAAEWTHRTGEALGDHDYGVCVHANGFGTRSSSLIRIGAERAFAHAEGPPCETAYELVEDPL